MFAKDIMTRKVRTIHSTNSVRTAIELMVNEGISGIPVVDENDVVTGIITEGDLLRRVEFGAGAKRENPVRDTPLRDLETYIKGHSWRVGDLMSTQVVTVTSDASVATVAELLFRYKIKRVPVVEDGRLVGLVSRVDLLRSIVDIRSDAIASGEEAMERAIRARLNADLGIDKERVSVSVHGGCIYLDGNVTDNLEKRAVQVLIENIQGGYSFVNRLSVSS